MKLSIVLGLIGFLVFSVGFMSLLSTPHDHVGQNALISLFGAALIYGSYRLTIKHESK